MNKQMAESNFIVQLKTFNFEFPLEKDLDNHSQLFVQGIKHWTSNELVKAQEVLERLYLNGPNGELAYYTTIALLGVLLALQDYDKIKKLELSKALSVDPSEVGLALAFQQFPEEEYSFLDLEKTMDFEFSNTGCPMIEVKINGVSKRLWLDTGASTTVLSRSTADECGISDSHSSLTATADNTQFKVGVETAYADNLEMGNLTIENHPLVIMADEMLQLPDPKTKATITIDGIIGWSAIRNIKLDIDYKGKTVTIAKHLPTLPQASNMFAAIRPVISLRTSDQRILRFGLDTGAGFSSIAEKSLTDNDLASVQNRTVTVATVGGMKEIQSKEIINQTLYTHNNQELFMEKLKVLPNVDDWATFFQLDGVFGSDAFQNSVLGIDFLNGIVKIQVAGS